jgi:hypothetical protein
MKYRTRIQYTETDKALMWERWRQGESLRAIGGERTRATATEDNEELPD